MIKKPHNDNYAANIVKIENLIPLTNCDNVLHTSIYGNLVVIDKNTKIGDIGIFFPIETQLSKQFLFNNNLYRDCLLNKDQTQKGYFELNGRIKAVKFRGHKSMGLFMPLKSLDWTECKEDLNIGLSFDELNGYEICKKYIIEIQNSTKSGKERSKNNQWKKVSILIDNQLRFHVDTSQLGKNIHKIQPDTLIHVSRKLHGCAAIFSKVLCKKKLSMWNKIGKFLKFNIIDYHYQNIYASRRVVKNDILNPPTNHYYSIDIWGKANEKIKDHLIDGMTVYAEIVGYVDDTKMIQKGYDYSCKPGEFDIYIYRITHTNLSGHVHEYSANQVQAWCKLHGFKAVTEYFYGKAKDIFNLSESFTFNNEDAFQNNLLNFLQQLYLEKIAHDCIHKVPDEGIVLRIEDSLDIEPYKLKSWAFYEYETKQLDKGEIDIESNVEVE